eukprot:TRINITY_DN4935_c0_g1_i3.p1 TRINITY_DN4935_c0_g1~~TRINITY_DN4935_c0_g1_i3.p1  ORF type:complete len:310 (+),score=72.00 TRINITY_DN4935_c0_g1_i3:341-1270(+)
MYGCGLRGRDDGPADKAMFSSPTGAVADLLHNIVVADRDNHLVRVIDPDGRVRTLAGGGSREEGFGGEVRFAHPSGVSVDLYGNVLVADTDNHRIARISPQGGVSTLPVDCSEVAGPLRSTEELLNYPEGVAMDPQGNMWIACRGSNRVLKVTPEGKCVLAVGGSGFADGRPEEARFSGLFGICADKHGNAYIADCYNKRIRQVSPEGMVATVAGNGCSGCEDGTDPLFCSFESPYAVVVDDVSGAIYVADCYNADGHRLRKISSEGVSSVTLPDGAKLNYPQGVGIDQLYGDLLVADFSSHIVARLYL